MARGRIRSPLRPLLPLLALTQAGTAGAALAGLHDSPGGSLTVLGGAIVRAGDRQPRSAWTQSGSRRAWVRMPAESPPYGVVHFVGGAALGAAPQLVYDALLSSVSDAAGVAVVATAYDTGTDHTQLAVEVGEAFAECCAAEGVDGFPPSRVFRLGHSLGAKLLAILACSNPSPGALGTLAYNNFGVSESVAFATAMAQQLLGNSDPATAALISTALNFAQQVAAAQGVDIEFKPSPEELDRMLAANFAASSTSVWRFADDTLDSSQRLLDALPPSTPRLFAELPGTHTAPALLDLTPADIDPRLGLLLGGSERITLGDPELVAQLAVGIAEWIRPGCTPGTPALARGKLQLLPPAPAI